MKKQDGQLKSEKRPYRKPLLTPYGGIAELTRTEAGTCQDNKNAFNNANINCLS
jgi:hypothetical protein